MIYTIDHKTTLLVEVLIEISELDINAKKISILQ